MVFIKSKKIIAIFFIALILNTMLFLSFSKATNINSTNITSDGKSQNLIMYKGSNISTYYTYYEKDGIKYPAYNLGNDRLVIQQGVKYPVSAISSITDVQLWKIIINGYPYKTPQDLECKTSEEAYIASKQAISCYLNTYDENQYTGVNESGNRIVNAIKLILNNAKSSKETPISGNLKIVKEQEKFDTDINEKDYVSKTYSVTANSDISSYTVNIQKVSDDAQSIPDGIKITDENNNVKNEFNSNEKFKILIPIKKLTDENTFKIEAQTKIYSKPAFYGKSINPNQQDYILTSSSYDDVIGDTTDKYFKNETKLKIIKQDAESKARLSGVKFNILDNKQKPLYANLETNEQGEIIINNLLPGTYYIQETQAKEGYTLSNNLFEIYLDLNEECTVTVDNSFSEETVYTPEIKNQAKSYSNNAQRTVEKQNKKLPVTGM